MKISDEMVMAANSHIGHTMSNYIVKGMLAAALRAEPTTPTDESAIRNAALEEAAQILDEADKGYGTAATDLRNGERDRRFSMAVSIRLRNAAAAIRALKSDPATTAPKPFTFADPAAQREWERQRREGE